VKVTEEEESIGESDVLVIARIGVHSAAFEGEAAEAEAEATTVCTVAAATASAAGEDTPSARASRLAAGEEKHSSLPLSAGTLRVSRGMVLCCFGERSAVQFCLSRAAKPRQGTE
jgi:hypothetical protein